MNVPAWVQVGTEMVECNRGGYGFVAKIAKVHKTGHFTLDRTHPTGVKDTKRYRADNGINATTAQSVGDGWHWTNLEVVTDEVRAKIARYRSFVEARNTIKAEIDRLNALMTLTLNNKASNEVFAEADRIKRITDNATV